MLPTARQIYDAFAPYYRGYAEKKSSYLNRVDRLVLEHLPTPCRRMLDVGGGDGVRGYRLFQKTQASELWIVDSSPEMLRQAYRLASETVRVYPCDIADAGGEQLPPAYFDAVWCLWNVLGHVPEHQQRGRAIVRMAATLRRGGRLFIDVSNRYNIAQYGFRTVVRNVWADLARPGPQNGTVGYAITVAPGKTIASSSHFFRPGELAPLFSAAKLRPLQRVFVHYRSGAITHRWGGQAFFVVEKT